MKRVFSLIVAIAMIAVLIPGTVLAQEATAETAEALMQTLFDGDYETVYNASTADLQKALGGSADGLAGVMAQITQAYGAFEAIETVSGEPSQGYFVVQLVGAYETAELTFQLAFDTEGLLAGFSVTAVNPKTSKSLVDESAFHAEPITLRAGQPDATDGMLLLPTGEGPFPAVIMMQGSGASDMNETVIGIAVFRDLAEGLAAAGVASIRYDKYTYAHEDLMAENPELLASFTVNEEYILDAQAALELLQNDERIGDIYLLGHSQGAMLAPRIMDTLGADSFGGAVLIAGSPLHLWEIQYHQNLAFVKTLAEKDQSAAMSQIEAMVAQADTLPGMTADELKQTTLFGVPAYYQADEMSVDAAQTAIKLAKPLFIVQGAKDWQATPADGIQAWQAALADSTFATYKLYPDMNHLLVDMQGEPTGSVDDYVAGSHVKQELIDDIAAWILGR